MRRMAPRLLALLLALTLLLTAAACGGGAAVLDDKAFANPDPRYGMLKIAHNFSNMYGENVCVPFFDTLRNSGYEGLAVSYTHLHWNTSKRQSVPSWSSPAGFLRRGGTSCGWRTDGRPAGRPSPIVSAARASWRRPTRCV